MIPGHKWLALLTLLASVHAFLATAGQPVAAEPAPTGLGAAVSNLFSQKVKLYLGSLPEEQQQLLQGLPPAQLADRLRPTLRFLYEDSYTTVTQHGFIVPELGELFVDEGSMLFGNISYVRSHSSEISFEQGLRLLLATLRSFDPTRFTTLLTAYPICRRAVTALLLERFLTSGNFSDSEGQLVLGIGTRLFELHRQAAQTKRIVEFFHVSKSGGTSFCQLGRLNGCKTEGFDSHRNCLITYFRDHPRWTVADALPALSAATPGMREPWCARFGRQYSFKWHCRARRQHMTKNRFNIYANELVLHDQANLTGSGRSSWLGVHPCREFLNVVIFREPAERVVSHMQNIIKEYVRFYNASTFFKYFDKESPEQWRALAVPVMDNYVVRCLLGGKVFNLPGGAINATHLLAAKIISLQFEVLLSLGSSNSNNNSSNGSSIGNGSSSGTSNNGSSSSGGGSSASGSSSQQQGARELTRDIFGLGLGWPMDLRHLHARPTPQRPQFSDPVMAAVRQATVYDQDLYEFALVLQGLDAIVFGVAHDLAGAGGGGGGGGGGGVEESGRQEGGEGGDAGEGDEEVPGGASGGAASSSANGTFLGAFGGSAFGGSAFGGSAVGGGAVGGGAVGGGGAKRKRPRRTCGYVGQVRRAVAAAASRAALLAAPPPPPPEAWLAALAQPLTLMLSDGQQVEVPLRFDTLGEREVAGGRWFNGTFFANSTEAVARAVAAAREAALVEAEALREERNAELQARHAVREKRVKAWGQVRGRLGADGGGSGDGGGGVRAADGGLEVEAAGAAGAGMEAAGTGTGVGARGL